jgi:hypothetical protein
VTGTTDDGGGSSARRGGEDGDGGASAVVQATVAPAHIATQRGRRLRHELTAPVHHMPARARRVVPEALEVHPRHGGPDFLASTMPVYQYNAGRYLTSTTSPIPTPPSLTWPLFSVGDRANITTARATYLRRGENPKVGVREVKKRSRFKRGRGDKEGSEKCC